MIVYITGMAPPVCHTDRNCFGIIFNPRKLEVESLSGVPDHYEMCMFCNPLGQENLTSGQKIRVEELGKLFQGGTK